MFCTCVYICYKSIKKSLLQEIKQFHVGTQVKTPQGLSCGMGSKLDLLFGISLLDITWLYKLTYNSLNEI